MSKQYQDVSDELNAVAAEHPEMTVDDSEELVEEIADTATIHDLLDEHISTMEEIFEDVIKTSLEGNPVRTHVELVNAVNDAFQMALELKAELVARLANRAEELPETGLQMRKQIVDEQLVTPLAQARRPLSSIEKTEEN